MKLNPITVSEELMEGLRQVMADPSLDAFHLVGGTSLALRFGHRRSIDIDVFSAQPFDAQTMAAHMTNRHGLRDAEVTDNTVRGFLNGVKLDMIAHVYPLLAPVDTLEGVRMASLSDIAAMKLNAISNRGSKKDFWDYALLLDHFSHGKMLEFFSCKYAAFNLWHVEKSVVYFDDAELDPDPVDLIGQTWDDVKKKVRSQSRNQ